MKALTMILASSLSLAICAADAEPMLSVSGPLLRSREGWSFVPSKPNADGATFNEFEGFYPDKGGKLQSPRIPLVGKAEGKGAYYRISFTAKALTRGYVCVNFYDADGKALADNYDVLYKTEGTGNGERGTGSGTNGERGTGSGTNGEWGTGRHYDRVFYAMGQTTSFDVFFQSKDGYEVRDLRIEPATWADAADYCDRVLAALPPFSFAAPANATALLPRTMEALRTGKPWRVVMLGDSIVQDAFHSQFHSLVKRAFPASDAEWIVSVRGSTGCQTYAMADEFFPCVVDKRPDLLLIGGISNYVKKDGPDGAAAIMAVARAAHDRLGCEVLVTSAALHRDLRTRDPANPDAPIPPAAWNSALAESSGGGARLEELRDLCAKNGFPFWDLTTPCYEWLFASGLPFEFYSRDAVHSGELGKQIIARALFAHFASEPSSR